MHTNMILDPIFHPVLDPCLNTPELDVLMFKKTQIMKGLTMNLVLGLFKQCSRVQIFYFSVERNLMDVALTSYGINFKIINLDLF